MMLVAVAAWAACAGAPAGAQILSSGGSVNNGRAAGRPAVAAPSTGADNRGPDNPGRAFQCLLGGGVGGIIGALRGMAGGGLGQGIQNGARDGCRSFSNWSAGDQTAFGEATEATLDDDTGRSHQFTARDAREQVTLRASAATAETRQVDFRHYSNVAAPPAGSHVVARPYRARVAVRLRSSPDGTTAGNVVGRFEPGETVEVVALTPEGVWAMLGEEGVIVGYAEMNLFTTLDAPRGPRRVATARARAAAPRGEVKTTPTMASTQCKSLSATRGAGRAGRTMTAKGCTAPNGRWIVA